MAPRSRRHSSPRHSLLAFIMAMACTTAQAPPLLLTAGDGPWAWSSVRYDLLAGSVASGEHTLTYSLEDLVPLQPLGSVTATIDGEAETHTFRFGGGAQPLVLSLTGFEGAGVGHRVWDSAIAMALYQRSPAFSSDVALATPVDQLPRVLELGAGVGLPGIDMARRGAAASVTLSDARPKLLALQRRNAAAAGGADVRVAQLAWGPAEGEADLELSHAAASDEYDVVVGSDVIYEEAHVQGLADLIRTLRAPLTIIIGPVTRPSVGLLADELAASAGVHVEQRQLTLLCRNAEQTEQHEERVRSAGVHRVLVVRQEARR